MRSCDMRRVPAGLVVAAVLALVPVVYAQDAIVPFRIQVPNAVLTDLKQRLTNARFADDFGDPGWDYGTNPAYLKEFVAYWRDTYDWRAHERRLNQYDQFKTNIDGLNIHFVHQRSANPNATPLLLLNGWPSSIEEYAKVIGPLTDTYHVIVPSMPGFGFSDKPKERGYHVERIAGLWVTLMARLGYARYNVHGSDFGSLVATHLALKDPMHVASLHIAGCGGAAAPPAANAGGAPPPTPPTPPTPPPSGLNSLVNGAHGLGYAEIMSTKTQTIGPAITDSPVGLASWIIEKWYGLSDHDGDMETIFTKDGLLTNVMVYWVTNSAASSARIYFENRHMTGTLGSFFPRAEGRVIVPTGCGAFPRQYDRRGVPVNPNTAAARAGADTRYNVAHFTTAPRGGHFPAYEQPALWLEDIRTFLRSQR